MSEMGPGRQGYKQVPGSSCQLSLQAVIVLLQAVQLAAGAGQAALEPMQALEPPAGLRQVAPCPLQAWAPQAGQRLPQVAVAIAAGLTQVAVAVAAVLTLIQTQAQAQAQPVANPNEKCIRPCSIGSSRVGGS